MGASESEIKEITKEIQRLLVLKKSVESMMMEMMEVQNTLKMLVTKLIGEPKKEEDVSALLEVANLAMGKRKYPK